MNLATVIALCLFALLGIGVTLNADLVATRFPLATGYGSVEAPVILILVLLTAGSWFLFLVATAVSQQLLLQRIERLSAALADKEREMLRAKATFFDQSVNTLQSIAARLDRRVRELEPVLAARQQDPGVQTPAGRFEPRAL